jgi:hypothetical protein
MNSAELMDSVFDIYKKSFFKQLAFSALVGVVSMVLMVVAGIAVAAAAIVPMMYNPTNDSAAFGLFFAVLAVMLPLYGVWNATANAGYIMLSGEVYHGRKVRLPLRQMPVAVLRVLTAGVAQLLMGLPFLALIALFIYAAYQAVLPFAAGVWIAALSIGSLIYIIYSNLHALAVPVAVFEKRAFFGTVFRSWQLMKGEFWKILGLRVLWTIIVFLFTYSAQGIWMVVSSVLGTASAAVYTPLTAFFGNVLTLFIYLIISFVMGPLGGIFPALLYFNQCGKARNIRGEIS